jgi:hypothetical protein
MHNRTIDDLKTLFPNNAFTETRSNSNQLFVYDVKKLDANGHKIGITIMSDTKLDDSRCFEIENSIIENEVAHICIDGDFITYGQHKYDGDSAKTKDGRPDCLIFDENRLLFVELKLDQEDATFDKEKTKWKKFFEGITQIEDFNRFLKRNGFDVKDIYSDVRAVISLRFEPIFRPNSARNNEKLRRSIALGFPVISHDCSKPFKIS